MALKDITLGQYFPGNSLLHRFDPRSKILFTVLFIAAIFLCKGLVSYGITLLILLMMIGISKVQPRVFLKGMKPVVFIVVCTAILNLFYTSGTVLWSWGILKITEEGIWKAGFMVLRILMLIACTLLLTYTTSPILLTDGLEKRRLRQRQPHPEGQGPHPHSDPPLHLVLPAGGGAGHRHGVPLLPRGRGAHQPAAASLRRAGLWPHRIQHRPLRRDRGPARGLWPVRRERA